jgi:diguanylate cyclase (GGDEF)-like protein
MTPHPSPSVLAQFVERARGLYSLPAVALRVLELTSQPQVDVRALKECIENDPALTTKILRVVNSSLFGLQREVTDLGQALAQLGTKPLKMLVLGFSLPKNLFTVLEAEVLARYWRHTLTKAVVCRELCQRCYHQPGDEAFIAGLLQEIGQLALVQDLGEPYVRFVDRVTTSGGDLLALEMQTLGFDHTILSARLLDHWRMPQSIVRAVAVPHDVDRIRELPLQEQLLPQVLHLAELISQLLVAQRPQALEPLSNTAAAYARFSLEDLPALLEDLGEKVDELASVLDLEVVSGGDYRGILADAHAQLARVAGEVALELLEPAIVQETAALNRAAEELAQAIVLPPERKTVPIVRRAAAPAVAAGQAASGAAHKPATTPADWSDPGLAGRLGAAISACRQAREPLCLLLASVDRFEELIWQDGREAADAFVSWLESTLRKEFSGIGQSLHLGDGEFAILLADHDRSQGLDAARQLQRASQRWPRERHSAHGAAPTLSIGVAALPVPPRNFPAAELIAAAQRCLHAAQLTGGDTIKSIEIV